MGLTLSALGREAWRRSASSFVAAAELQGDSCREDSPDPSCRICHPSVTAGSGVVHGARATVLPFHANSIICLEAQSCRTLSFIAEDCATGLKPATESTSRSPLSGPQCVPV